MPQTRFWRPYARVHLPFLDCWRLLIGQPAVSPCQPLVHRIVLVSVRVCCRRQFTRKGNDAQPPPQICPNDAVCVGEGDLETFRHESSRRYPQRAARFSDSCFVPPRSFFADHKAPPRCRPVSRRTPFLLNLPGTRRFLSQLQDTVRGPPCSTRVNDNRVQDTPVAWGAVVKKINDSDNDRVSTDCLKLR